MGYSIGNIKLAKEWWFRWSVGRIRKYYNSNKC